MGRCVLGELSFIAWIVVLFGVFDVRVFVVPLVRHTLCHDGGQLRARRLHRPSRPAKQLPNSVTSVNANYNRRCHQPHWSYLKPTRHWTELPEDFAHSIERYVTERAIVSPESTSSWFGSFLCSSDATGSPNVRCRSAARRRSNERVCLLRTRFQWRRPQARSRLRTSEHPTHLSRAIDALSAQDARAESH
jgi:hypothetical protein